MEGRSPPRKIGGQKFIAKAGMAGPASRSGRERERVGHGGTGGRESGGEGGWVGANGNLGAAIGDARFSRLHMDPRFQRLPKNKAKVSIDSRFAGVFQDEVVKDARGGGSKSSDLVRSLRRYYKLDDESAPDEGIDGEEQVKKPVSEKKRSKRNQNKTKENELTDKGNEKSKKNLSGKLRADPRSVVKVGKRSTYAANAEPEIDEQDGEVQGLGAVARARVKFAADSESDEDSELSNESGPSEEQDVEEEDELSSASSSLSSSSQSESDVDEAGFSHSEDEQKVATTSEETRRLAMMHMDWDHIRALDLLVLARSFVPRSGSVLSVTIYPSEFGIEQMKEENVQGPQGIFRAHDEEDDGDEGADLEKLREYEKSKLKYYYAVVECDSAATAAHLYQQCDGLEFERTSNTLDLRYIPDAMEFKHEPRDMATEAPSEYKPVEFETRALQYSNVKLTWDDDEPVRKKALRRNFNAEELNEMDFRDYVASSSGSDSDSEAAGGGTPMAHVGGSKDGKEETDKEDVRAKYHALLASTERSDFGRGKKAEKGDIEIKFHTGLDELSEKLLNKAQKDKADETVWEAYLRRKKEKKNARKGKMVSAESDVSNGKRGIHNQSRDDAFFSHGDEDPFFTQDDEGNVPVSEAKKGKGNKVERKEKDVNGSNARDKDGKRKRGEASRQKKEAEKKAGELELLLLDDHLVQNGELPERPSGLQIDEGKQKSKKKKGVKSRNAIVTEKVASSANYEDPRFASLFTSHHFSLDPTDPHYKKAGSHVAELQRQRFRASENAKEQPESTDKYDCNQKEKSELFSLARSLKAKVQRNATGKKRKHS